MGARGSWPETRVYDPDLKRYVPESELKVVTPTERQYDLPSRKINDDDALFAVGYTRNEIRMYNDGEAPIGVMHVMVQDIEIYMDWIDNGMKGLKPRPSVQGKDWRTSVTSTGHQQAS